MTPDEQAEKIQTDIYRGMTPEQKWNLGKMLLNAAESLKKAGIRKNHPAWTDQQVENEMRKFFGRG